MSSSSSTTGEEHRQAATRDSRKSSSASSSSNEDDHHHVETRDSRTSSVASSSSEISVCHHTNWICCACKKWTNHPTYTCRRLLSGYTLIDYTWKACAHDKCEECVKITVERWEERFPY